MLADIERSCAQALRARVQKLSTNRAEGGITSDGLPHLDVDPSVTPTEELIVHELSHIQLAIEGFPKLDLVGHPEWHLWMRSDILDVVQHRIFYPRLQNMGFTPAQDRITEARRIIAQGDFRAKLHPLDIASRYFRVAMETADEPLLADMAAWYRSKGWQDALRIAQEAYDLASARTAWTPQDEVDTIIACANVFCRRLRTFRFVRHESEQYGKIAQHFAVIAIE